MAIAVAAGCGGDDAPGPDEVRAAVTTFFEAGNERDAETLCGLVTSDQAKAFGRSSGGDCESGMTTLLEEADPPRIEVIIEDVRVRGDRATVDATLTQGGDTRASSLSLIQEDGEWKLTDPDL
jgi:hypothetical protein